LLLHLPRFALSAETQALLAGDQRNLASYRQVREILGDTEAAAVSLALTNLFTVEGLATVRALSDAFERQPDVIEVKSLTHAVRPVRRGLGFEMGAGTTVAVDATIRRAAAVCRIPGAQLWCPPTTAYAVTVHFGRQAVRQAGCSSANASKPPAPFRAAGSEPRPGHLIERNPRDAAA
jgi:hypothetical protein